MALEFLGALVAAVAFGGMALLARRLSGGKLPKVLVPLAAFLGLIGTTISLEYGWYGRVSGALPPQFEVIESATRGSAMRPWSFLVPITMSFTAMDHSKTTRHPQVPGLRMVLLYDFARWQNVDERLVVVDCAAARQALMVVGAEISEDGSLTGAEWVKSDDKLQEAACREG